MAKKKTKGAKSQATQKIHPHKVFFFAIFIFLFGFSASAYVATSPSFWRNIDLAGKYIWLPDIVGSFFEGSIINLHFKMASSEVLDVCGTVSSQDSPIDKPAGIFNLSWQVCDKYDFDVSMSDLNALELATSTSPIRTFIHLKESGDLKVVPNGKDNLYKFNYAQVNFYRKDGQPVPESIRSFFEKIKSDEAKIPDGE